MISAPMIATLMVIAAFNLVFVVIVLIHLDDLNRKVDDMRRSHPSPGPEGGKAPDDDEEEEEAGDGEKSGDAAAEPQEEDTQEIPQEIYEKSVYRWIELMHRIEALKKPSGVQRQAFRCLAGLEPDLGTLLQAVREGVTDADMRTMYNTLAYDIEAYMKHERPVIDAYLARHGVEGVSSYQEAVTMPEGESFNPAQHIDIFDEASVGDRIERVLSLGYDFPHSTTAPYAERPKVQC